MSVRGDPLRDLAGDRLRRAEEGFGRGYVPVLAEHGVDQIAMMVDHPIQVAPSAPDLEIGLVDMPGAAASSVPTTPAAPEFAGQNRGELGLPRPHGFVAEQALRGHRLPGTEVLAGVQAGLSDNQRGDCPPQGHRRAHRAPQAVDRRADHRPTHRCRRLAKHWERLNQNALAFLHLASVRLMVRKLCQNTL
jgi:hypothetical protein